MQVKNQKLNIKVINKHNLDHLIYLIQISDQEKIQMPDQEKILIFY